jgi:histidinol-phosphatase (PHP family)
MTSRKRELWRCSLHGGHSGQFCDHARGTLREVIEAAIAEGIDTYGVSEHAPRTEDRFTYEEERALGWDAASFEALFCAYIDEVARLADEYADRITILRGYECEVVPEREHVAIMDRWRERGGFAFRVGSVHYVGELQIDGPRDAFEAAIAHFGGVEALAVAYYDRVAKMVADLRPEVVGHLDLMRKNGVHYGLSDTPLVVAAQQRALESVREHEGILDLNTAGWRKQLGSPYPGPALVKRAHAMGIPFCFGDDSHGPNDVGFGLDAARAYLLGLGVTTITTLTPDGGRVVRDLV